MNLNEECLLQYLQNSAAPKAETAEWDRNASAFQTDMRRVIRRNRFVSFPAAILVRKPYQE